MILPAFNMWALATVDVHRSIFVGRADVQSGHDFSVQSRADIDAFSIMQRRYHLLEADEIPVDLEDVTLVRFKTSI